MIPLRVNVEVNADQPFVVRLRSFESDGREREPEQLNPFDVSLERADPDGADYTGEGGPIRVLGIDLSELDGDVLLVNPRRPPHSQQLAAQHLLGDRAMRPGLRHVFPPPKKHDVDLFPYFETAALLAPEGATIGISGGEPTLFKEQLFSVLKRVLDARPDLSFHILTNGQHFEEG